jgi:hypothetical protein
MAKQIVVIGIKEASRILREHGMQISDGDLRAGIEQKVYPFGDAVTVTSKPVFHVYQPLLMQWINERSVEVAE